MRVRSGGTLAIASLGLWPVSMKFSPDRHSCSAICGSTTCSAGLSTRPCRTCRTPTASPSSSSLSTFSWSRIRIRQRSVRRWMTCRPAEGERRLPELGREEGAAPEVRKRTGGQYRDLRHDDGRRRHHACAVELTANAVTLSVNSEARAAREWALLEPVLTGLVRAPLIERQTVEKMMASARDRSSAQDPLRISPNEECRIIHKGLTDHLPPDLGRADPESRQPVAAQGGEDNERLERVIGRDPARAFDSEPCRTLRGVARSSVTKIRVQRHPSFSVKTSLSAASLYGANSHCRARPRRSHSLLIAFSTRTTNAARCVSLATLRW